METKDVWVVPEHLAGKVEDITLKMIGERRRLAQKLRGKSVSFSLDTKRCHLYSFYQVIVLTGFT